VVPPPFGLVTIKGGCPFKRVSWNPLAAGLLLLIASYVVTYVVFRVFYNDGFLQGTPAYLRSAPKGTYNGVSACVFYVTALAVMFVVLCFDLWPMTLFPAVMKQPVLGLVWTAIALAGAAVAVWIGIISLGADPMAFLTQVTVPVIFGSIIVLNMLQNSLFAKHAQPLKGVLNTIAAVAIGVILARLYTSLVPFVSGSLPSGP